MNSSINQQTGYKVASLGDYNSWLGTDDEYGILGDVHQIENSNGILLKNHFRSTGLQVVNRMDICKGGPVTYMDRMGRQSCLDLCNVSEGVVVNEMVIDSGLRDELDIDHVPIRLSLKIKGVKAKKKVKNELKGWFVSEDADWRVYKEVIERNEVEMDDIDVNVVNKRLCNLLVNTAFSTNVYKKTKQKENIQKRRTLPEKLLNKIRHRKEKFALLRDLQRRGAGVDDLDRALGEARLAEQEEKNSFQVMRAGKFKRVRDLCKNGGKEGSAAFWKCVKGVDQNSDPIDVVKTKEGLRTADEDLIKRTAEEHFAGVFNAKQDVEQVEDEESVPFVDKTREPNKKLSEESKESLAGDFTYEELKQAIKETSLDKSAGLDKVKNELLKNLPESVERQILKFFNKVKSQKTTPLSWRRGRVRLLHKGKDKTDLGNYRPITLCSCLSKLFTRMLNKRISEAVEKDEVLPKEQVGFR